MKKHIQFAVLICFLAISCNKDEAPLRRDGINGKSVGSSAHDLLSNDIYKSLKIEVQYMPGFKPSAAAISNLQSFVSGSVNKSSGITVIQTEIPSANKEVLSIQDIQDIEKRHRTAFTNGTEMGVYFLFTDGSFTQGNALGVAYLNTSMCIFGQTIHDNSGSVLMPSREKLETTVLNHEFGHILGLVDIGSPMVNNHKDNSHPEHCSVTSCLMYFQVETTDAISNLANTPVPALDSQCRADLRANGGK